MFSILYSFIIILPFLTAINAANDWTVPCITGECSYDLTNNGSASGTVAIWGAHTSISDITTAADWEILGCNPNALSQDIRLVCKSPGSAKCAHLYGGKGAVDKIVRLPENCGSSAFARVAKAWVPADQSIPSTVAARLARRTGTTPQVKALTLDTNFGSVDSSKNGAVNIAIQGANVPGAAGTISVPPSRRSTRLSERGLLGFVKSAVKSIASNSINVNKSVDLKPLDLTKSISLLDKSIKCGAVTASVKADLDASAHATAKVGVAATGTLIPPKLTDFAVITGLTASVDGTLDLTADVAGSIDSGKIQLVNVGIPGLDFPGILTVGPSFTVDAELTGSFDVNLDMKVGIVFEVNNAQLSFPSGTAPAANAFSVGDTPLTLSASPNVKATGTVAAHLIPSLNLGLSALGGKAQATVFVDLDTSASLKLELDATATAATTINKRLPEPISTLISRSELDPERRAVSASFGGCFEVDAGVEVNVGADGSFFGLFDKSVEKTLFSKDFEIFKKCFGSAATKRSLALLSRLDRESTIERRALSCPAASVKGPVSVVDETVKAAAIKAA